jgi:uncharacterized protein YuzE
MRISYNREEDIIIIEVSEEGIDYAEEVGPMIIHFTRERKPVLVEILDASDFLAEITKVSLRAKDSKLAEVLI